MNYMYDTYGAKGQFIGIAVHNGDPMTVTEYDSGAGLTGFPGCNVDRAVKDATVSQNAFEGYYNDRKDMVVPAGVVTNTVVNGNDVAITVEATFVTPMSAADFAIGVVITQDSMSGTTTAWSQSNAYAGGGSGFNGRL